MLSLILNHPGIPTNRFINRRAQVGSSATSLSQQLQRGFKNSVAPGTEIGHCRHGGNTGLDRCGE